MKKLFVITLSLIPILSSCQKESSPEILSFKSLFGRKLECKYERINTKLFFLSPHVIGIPINEDGFEFEYFHSVGSKKDTNSLYYQSSFRSKSNFQSAQSAVSESTRRLRVTIKDNKLYVTAITELDAEKIPINPVVYECGPGSKIQF